jgi:hypothetical protein
LTHSCNKSFDYEGIYIHFGINYYSWQHSQINCSTAELLREKDLNKDEEADVWWWMGGGGWGRKQKLFSSYSKNHSEPQSAITYNHSEGTSTKNEF